MNNFFFHPIQEVPVIGQTWGSTSHHNGVPKESLGQFLRGGHANTTLSFWGSKRV